MRKAFYNILAASIALSALSLTACADGEGLGKRSENVLRVASWDEYIDEGGEDSYVSDSRALYEEFEDWYFEKTNKKITVEYVTLQDNETMYNKIKMGDEYDLLCPSEYMIMKLARENMLQEFPQSFFDANVEANYYAQYLSPYIKNIFDSLTVQDGKSLNRYAAGYMWGSTGFVYNPQAIKDENAMSDWDAFNNPACYREITAKDNVRDSYFAGLGLYYQDRLNDLKKQLDNGTITQEAYAKQLSEWMNDTSPATVQAVKNKLIDMRKNLYGLETDEGKLEVAAGRLNASYQWSGDAVYILDVAESGDLGKPLTLEYAVPKSASNLWFDGWVMMKGANVDAATAFINFLSKPINVIRNMYYIGYTSCIGGDEVFSYVEETYSDETAENSYDVSYFFGEGYSFKAADDQFRRQLFAQYPDSDTIKRLVVMQPFDKKTNETVNRMWNNIK